MLVLFNCIIQEYTQLVRGAEGVLNSEGFGNNIKNHNFNFLTLQTKLKWIK